MRTLPVSRETSAYPKKLSAKQKLDYKTECEAWCAAHVWKEDSQYHQLGEYVRHKTDGKLVRSRHLPPSELTNTSASSSND